MTNSNRPTHTVNAVIGEGSKSRWREIGVAWQTKDQKGLILQLDCFPRDGRVIVQPAERRA